MDFYGFFLSDAYPRAIISRCRHVGRHLSDASFITPSSFFCRFVFSDHFMFFDMFFVTGILLHRGRASEKLQDKRNGETPAAHPCSAFSRVLFLMQWSVLHLVVGPFYVCFRGSPKSQILNKRVDCTGGPAGGDVAVCFLDCLQLLP